MNKPFSIFFNNHLLKSTICIVLTAVAVITFASSGGGGDKNRSALNAFTPVRTSHGFTLKTGPVYHGSKLLTQQKQNNFTLYSSVVTYQKGNVTYILPYKYKLTLPTGKVCGKTNLTLLDLKIRLHK